MDIVIGVLGILTTLTLWVLGAHLSYKHMITGSHVMYRYTFWFFCLQFVTPVISVVAFGAIHFGSGYWLVNVLGNIGFLLFNLAPALLVVGCYRLLKEY